MNRELKDTLIWLFVAAVCAACIWLVIGRVLGVVRAAPAPLPKRERELLDPNPDPLGAWDVTDPHGEKSFYILYSDHSFGDGQKGYGFVEPVRAWKISDEGELHLEWQLRGRCTLLGLVWDSKRCVWRSRWEGGWTFKRRNVK